MYHEIIHEIEINIPENENHVINIEFDNTNYKEVSNQLMSEIDIELGEEDSLSVDVPLGNDIECTVHRNNSNNERLLYCLNWEDKAYDATISLNLSSGFYKIDKIDMVSVRSMAKVGGSEVFNSSELRLFKLRIKKGDTFVLRIQGVE